MARDRGLVGLVVGAGWKVGPGLWLALAELALMSSGRLPIGNGVRIGGAGDQGKAKDKEGGNGH